MSFRSFRNNSVSGVVLRGGGAPIQKSALWPPNEVHHADILIEVYAIESLGLYE